MRDLDAAARRTAVNLMRLNEALELDDADAYTGRRRMERLKEVRHYYKTWFTRVAVRGGPGEVASADGGDA